MNDLVNTALVNWHTFEEPNISEQMDQLKLKDHLTVGDALVYSLYKIFCDKSRVYFYCLWRINKYFLPICDADLEQIEFDDLHAVTEGCSKGYEVPLINRLIDFVLSIKTPVDKKNLFELSTREHIAYLNNLSFPENYQCRKEDTLEKVINYWLYQARSLHNEEYFMYRRMPLLKKFRPLKDIPFMDIKPEDIEKLASKETERKQVEIRGMYKMLSALFQSDTIPNSNGNNTFFWNRSMTEGGNQQKETYQQMANHFSFPEPYVCPKDISMQKLMQYFIYTNRKCVKADYFYRLMNAYINLKPLYDVPFSKVLWKDIENLTTSLHSKNGKQFFEHTFKKLTLFAYDAGVLKESYPNEKYIRSRTYPFVQNRYKAFIQNLSFSESYKFPKDVSLKTVMEYCMFQVKNGSMKGVLSYYFRIYKWLTPLHNVSFVKMSFKKFKKTIPKFFRYLNRVAEIFYYKMESIAYSMGIIKKRDESIIYHSRIWDEEHNQTAIGFLDHLYFPKNYTCPRNIRFKTLMEYWVYKNRNRYNAEYFIGTFTNFYKSMKPLHQVPYIQIRPTDILEVCDEKSMNMRGVLIHYYRAVDLFACRLGLIERPLSRTIHLKSTIRNMSSITILNKTEQKKLFDHASEKDTSVACTILLTGLRIGELYKLNTHSLQGCYLDVNVGSQEYKRRKLLLSETQLPIVQKCLTYVEQIGAKNIQKKAKITSIRRIVKRATERILGYPVKPSHLRFTFDYTMISGGVPICFMEKMRGTKSAFAPYNRLGYIHATQEILDHYRKGVMNYA